VPYREVLTLQFHGRLQNQGSVLSDTATPADQREHLTAYQNEMNAFAAFLKEQYFGDQKT
jgi:hypothetical protein